MLTQPTRPRALLRPRPALPAPLPPRPRRARVACAATMANPTARPPLHAAARVAAAPLFAALILAPGPALYVASLAAGKVAAVAASAAFALAAAVATAPVWLLAALAVAAVAHAASAPAVAEARRLRACLAEHSETLAGIDRGLTILYSHVDNVATLQLETSRRAAALRAELDAALAALLGDDGVTELKAAAADAATEARRARLSDADAAARLAGVRRAWVFAVVSAFALARVGPPPVERDAVIKPVLALPAPAAAAGVVEVEGEHATSPYVSADAATPPEAAAAALLGLLPFLKGFRKQGRA